MEALALDWLSLILRLLHVVTAIAWIGASFYFVWLDNSLAPPPAEKSARGVMGDLWAFHGGGIYEVAKYRLAPPVMPEKLHWFKWEAYSTWITGALLLMTIYYLRADLYLVGADKWLTSSAAAIAGSVMFVLGGVAIYEALVRTLAAARQRLVVGALIAVVIAACWLATRLFSDRAAFLHVGAMLASIMAANVWLGIIPAQQGFMRALAGGREPDPQPMRMAKLRSVHNNYLTLPVLLAMLSNHYPFLYGHPLNWALLASGMAITAYARHFFNLRHRGLYRPRILVMAGLATMVLAGLALWSRAQPPETLTTVRAASVDSSGVDTAGVDTSEDVIHVLIQTHCAVCHSAHPSLPGFTAAPSGLLLETPAQLQAVRAQAAVAVASGYMPLGNITGLSAEERARLLAWLR